MQFVKLAKVSDFANVRFKAFTIMGRRVAIFKEPDGTFYASEVSCKHQNADLLTGRIDGDIVTCPRHQWKYNLFTGECLTHNSARLRRHALKVEGDEIHVSLTPVDS